MNINPFERGLTTPGNTEDEKSYHRYLKLGGIINKTDYESALKRVQDTTAVDETRVKQAEGIAKFSGIELHNTKDTVDPRIILYGILRSDVRAEGVKRHHDEMGDEHIFAEALRMFGDVDSLKKLIEAYKKTNPSMSFKYPEEEVHEEEEKRAA